MGTAVREVAAASLPICHNFGLGSDISPCSCRKKRQFRGFGRIPTPKSPVLTQFRTRGLVTRPALLLDRLHPFFDVSRNRMCRSAYYTHHACRSQRASIYNAQSQSSVQIHALWRFGYVDSLASRLTTPSLLLFYTIQGQKSRRATMSLPEPGRLVDIFPVDRSQV